MPYVAQVAVGRREFLSVYGDDYDTPDGTGVRDYIHAEDLAVGHLSALRKMETSAPALRVYNLGTGKGYSVLDMVRAMEKAAQDDPLQDRRGARATSPPSTPTRRRRRTSSAGPPSWASTGRAVTSGRGRARTRWASSTGAPSFRGGGGAF